MRRERAPVKRALKMPGRVRRVRAQKNRLPRVGDSSSISQPEETFRGRRSACGFGRSYVLSQASDRRGIAPVGPPRRFLATEAGRNGIFDFRDRMGSIHLIACAMESYPLCACCFQEPVFVEMRAPFGGHIPCAVTVDAPYVRPGRMLYRVAHALSDRPFWTMGDGVRIIPPVHRGGFHAA